MLALAGCDAIYGIKELGGNEAGSATDGATDADAFADDANEGPDVDAAPEVRCTTESDAGGAVDRDWAQWAMPNSPVEVEAGAPHAERYTANGNGTVTDQVTGLVWQETLPTGNVDATTALGECASASTAGYCDWRLPTYVELQSIVDLAKASPAVDPKAFAGMPAYVLWTSSPVAGSIVNGWSLGFGTGAASQEPLANPHHFRCVRAGAVSDAGSPPARYSVVSGTVLDVATGLGWQQATSTAQMTWTAAQSYCATLSLDGSGWRLPTLGELVTLIDVTQTMPAIDAAAFPGTQAKAYWSATPQAAASGSAWAVQFYDGNTNPFSVATTMNYARCVR